MAQVVISDDAKENLDRLFEFLVNDNPQWAIEAVFAIHDGLRILNGHPLVGRQVGDSPLRELIISKGRSGYVALYEYDEIADEAVIMAIRHQRESGYN